MKFDFITGYGREDTQRVLRGQYQTGSYEHIVQMAKGEQNAAPCHSPKDARWAVFIDTDGPDTRSAHHHRATYGANSTTLWMDFDEGDPTFEQIVAFAAAVANGHAFLVYTSRSHGEQRANGTIKQKYRIIWPHSTKLPIMAYNAFGLALSKLARDWGLIPDPVAERPTQICYLPNRGPQYQYHEQVGPRMDLGGEYHHWLYQGAMEIYKQQEHEYTEFLGRNETDRSPVAAFCRKHSPAQMLETYGFNSFDGTNWHSDQQSTRSFGTKVDDDGRGWVTSSGSVEQILGRKNGDAFDIYVKMQCNGNTEHGMAYARLCLAEEDDLRYGDATALHGTWLLDRMYVMGVALGVLAKAEAVAAVEAEAVAVQEHVAELKSAEELKWGGEWRKEVPFNIPASKLEWLAWHAPNVVGKAVRSRAGSATRHTVVPMMLGAIGALSYVGQGKFVALNSRHVTPVGVMLFQVGASGSGKSDGTGTFYKLVNTITNKHDVRAHKTKTFASGASLTEYLSHHSSSVFMLQNEGGADRSAGKGGSHFESFMAAVTDAFTAFEDGIELTFVKSDSKDGKESKSIAHPTVGSLSSSTPKKLFASISNADGESGWLGRNLFIPLTPSLTNKKAVMGAPLDTRIFAAMNRINGVLPPIRGTVQNNVWLGTHESFHALNTSPEAEALLDAFTDECDACTIDQRRGEVERAVYARAAEGANRLATVVGLGHWAETEQLSIPAEVMWWCIELTKCSIEFVTSQMADVVDDDDKAMSPGGRTRNAVEAYFTKADVDKEFANKMGPSGAKRDIDGNINLGYSKLKRMIKKNLGVDARVVNAELEGMIADNELIEINELGMNHKVRWLRWVRI